MASALRGRPARRFSYCSFIPSVDRDEEPIDHEAWVDAALTALATLFRGATAYPRGMGKWRDDEREGILVVDEPTIVTSYVNPDDLTDEALVRLRIFLHRMGREARQGEMGIVVDGAYYPITHYDPE